MVGVPGGSVAGGRRNGIGETFHHTDTGSLDDSPYRWTHPWGAYNLV